MPYSLETTLPVLVALAASLLVGWLMLLTQRWHGHLSLDSEEGVQKFHTQATPRIGGLPVLVGLIGAWALLPAKARLLMAPLLLAAIPAFASGFIEDLTKKVGVGVRLACTVGSGALVCLLTGYSVREMGVWGMDWLLSFSLISIVFTALALGTMANGVNLIDGFNGLSAGSLIIMLSGLGWIALDAGDRDLALLAFVTAASILGFALLNWPWGKIFLGDGGAYLAGFITGAISVLLAARNSSVSSWAPIMVCAYPVLEVFFSIARRRYRKHHPGHPDRLHLHSLVRRRVTAFWLRQASVLGLNSVTGMLMWPASLLCTAWAVVFAGNSMMLFTGLVGVTLLYAHIYRSLVHFRWGSKRSAQACAAPGT